MDHPYALRTPWYVLERAKVGVRHGDARRPAIQKYVSDDFVDLLLKDPRASFVFDDATKDEDGNPRVPEDRWSYPVPVGFPGPGTGRAKFATHRMIHTPVRKLYQPNHDRFYALTLELFCDEAGLPRPGRVQDVDVRFVVRRERLVIDGENTDGRTKKARELAQQLAVTLFKEQNDGSPEPLSGDDVDDVLSTAHAGGRPFDDDQLALLQEIDADRIVEAWIASPGRPGRWLAIEDDPCKPELAEDEQEYPMWQLPPREMDCPAGRTRSLWFGTVPTLSGDLDATGASKLDDRALYRIRCFVRKRRDREGCPDKFWWSDATEPFRLAGFFDPLGTKNRRTTIIMPDFRAVAARAGQPAGPGGVEIVRPPGSQLMVEKAGDGEIPKEPKKDVNGNIDFGASTSRCTFALEIFTIVAMFLFSVFLPIVVFLFQLWWLLALRFCLPRPEVTLQLLSAYFENQGDLAHLPDVAAPDKADRAKLDALLEAAGGAERLAANEHFDDDPNLTGSLVEMIDPEKAAIDSEIGCERVPDDPLCRGLPFT